MIYTSDCSDPFNIGINPAALGLNNKRNNYAFLLHIVEIVTVIDIG